MRSWSPPPFAIVVRALVVVTLVVTASAGCDSRRSRHTHGTRTAATHAPEETPREDPPAPVAAPAPPPRPAPPPPAPPAPARPRAAPKDDRLGACGGGAGPRFNVRGVADDDTLNVRAAADPQSDVLGQLSPHATGVLSLGDRRKVGPSTWHKVKCGSAVGWVNERFLTPAAR